MSSLSTTPSAFRAPESTVYPLPAPSVTVSRLASSTVSSSTVGMRSAVSAAPAANATVAGRGAASASPVSVTEMFTLSAAAVGSVRRSVNTSGVPSVTGVVVGASMDTTGFGESRVAAPCTSAPACVSTASAPVAPLRIVPPFSARLFGVTPMMPWSPSVFASSCSKTSFVVPLPLVYAAVLASVPPSATPMLGTPPPVFTSTASVNVSVTSTVSPAFHSPSLPGRATAGLPLTSGGSCASCIEDAVSSVTFTVPGTVQPMLPVSLACHSTRLARVVPGLRRSAIRYSVPSTTKLRPLSFVRFTVAVKSSLSHAYCVKW